MKKILIFIILGIVLIGFSSSQQGYKFFQNSYFKINQQYLCGEAHNTNPSKAYFIPLNSLAEWTAFLLNPPSDVKTRICPFYNFAGNTPFIIPPGVNSIFVEVFGAGGGGGGYGGSSPAGGGNPGGGGGAGGYKNRTFSVTPGTSYNIVVGIGGAPGAAGASSSNKGTPGGAGGSGKNGSLSSFSSLLTAKGGGGGTGGGGAPTTDGRGGGGVGIGGAGGEIDANPGKNGGLGGLGTRGIGSGGSTGKPAGNGAVQISLPTTSTSFPAPKSYVDCIAICQRSNSVTCASGYSKIYEFGAGNGMDSIGSITTGVMINSIFYVVNFKTIGTGTQGTKYCSSQQPDGDELLELVGKNTARVNAQSCADSLASSCALCCK